MTRLLLPGLLVSIPTWLVTTLILDLVGDVSLSTTAFFVGGSLVTVLGLLLLTWDRPPRITIRLPILYSSIILFSLSAALFVYSYIALNASIPFYLALTLLILGAGLVLGIKRAPKV